MARIPETELERLKREISIRSLVEASGVTLRPQGADLVGCCPFHQDDTPSLHLSVEKNLWHCFGACAQGGSVLDWVMKAEGISFRHAVELLRTKGPAASSAAGAMVQRSRSVKLPPVVWDADERLLLRQVIDYYHATLTESPEALAYLQSRGLTSPEMLDHFRLGYANRTLGYRLPGISWKAGAEIRGRLQTLGILRASGHEHFVGSLVIPVLDAHGQVTEVYGRKIRDDLRPGTPTHLYLPGPHQGVWNLNAFTASKEIILCEALLDALTFWCAGYRHVTASYGVDGFTADHLATMKQFGTKTVFIAYDRDEAGDRAAAALATQLMAEGIGCWRVEFPKGMDANAYALTVQPAEKSLGLLLETARWLGPGPTPLSLSPVGISRPAPAPIPEAATAVPSPQDSEAPSFDPLRTAPESATPSTLDEVVLTFGPRRYRGLPSGESLGELRGPRPRGSTRPLRGTPASGLCKTSRRGIGGGGRNAQERSWPDSSAARSAAGAAPPRDATAETGHRDNDARRAGRGAGPLA
jgi:DNA primase